jgi:alkanesulfonate monooxygenase SsuD/methylene tetrahydromethanopterin reductase-like flavin-dependent oxidoreductase (luciferase family)
MTDLSKTREIWEDVIAELPKMWLEDTYPGYDGKYWSFPARKVLPKPYGPGHPAMWYAAGNVSSYEMAARRGLGVLGFSVSTLSDLDAVIHGYKKAIPNAEPVGAFVNDNVMVTVLCHVAEDEEKAIATTCSPSAAYHQSNVFRYHDTFPRPPQVPQWPALLPTATPEDIPAMRENGFIIGTPDHAIEQSRRWEAAGADQIVFATGHVAHEDMLETIRLVGEHVIPKLDTDPLHRTTRFRNALAK